VKSVTDEHGETTGGPVKRLRLAPIALLLACAAFFFLSIGLLISRIPARGVQEATAPHGDEREAKPSFLQQRPAQPRERDEPAPPDLTTLLGPRRDAEAPRADRPFGSGMPPPRDFDPRSSALGAGDDLAAHREGAAEALPPALGEERSARPGTRAAASPKKTLAELRGEMLDAALLASMRPASSGGPAARATADLGGASPPPMPPMPPMPDAVRRLLDGAAAAQAREAAGETHSTPDRRAALTAAGRPLLSAGRILEARLSTAATSDGQTPITAIVTRDLRDGRRVLIPAGSRLVGRLGSVTELGNETLGILWQRLVGPAGHEVAVSGLTASGADGSAGVRGAVNYHSGIIFGRALALSLIGATAQAAQPRNGTATGLTWQELAAAGGAQRLSDAGSRLMESAAAVRPSIFVPAGTALKVVVPEGLSLPPEGL
jgi:type IV secretory pathway VirB10-like protein